MNDKRKRVCPTEIAWTLDNWIRRWLHNPRKILGPFVERGMKVLDLGCGPGFFSIELADMVGDSGYVIASDIQEGMLQKLRGKIQGTELEKRIKLHQSKVDRIGVLEEVDFVLAFYMVHEVSNQKEFFNEIKSILRPKGLIFLVEPKLFHVSKKEFEETIRTAEEIGFETIEKPELFFSWSVVLRNGSLSLSPDVIPPPVSLRGTSGK